MNTSEVSRLHGRKSRFFITMKCTNREKFDMIAGMDKDFLKATVKYIEKIEKLISDVSDMLYSLSSKEAKDIIVTSGAYKDNVAVKQVVENTLYSARQDVLTVCLGTIKRWELMLNMYRQRIDTKG